MKVVIRAIVACVILVGMCPASVSSGTPATTPPRTLTLEEFGTEIERIESDVAGLKDHPEQAVALHDSIDDQFLVTTSKSQFTIDNVPLKLAIGEYKIANEDRRSVLLRAIESRLEDLKAGAREYVTPANDFARQKLNEVLSRKQFQNATGPTLIDIWKQRVSDWISRWLDKIFGSIPSRQSRNDVLAWILIAVVICILAIWIKRRAGRREPVSVRIPIPFAPSAKGWRTWLAEARAAAAENRWRDAVHLGYWAGISNLEENGAWIPDRARTPREYLQLIETTHPGRKELKELTNQFEVIWYGEAAAEPTDFNKVLRHLEVLGCR